MEGLIPVNRIEVEFSKQSLLAESEQLLAYLLLTPPARCWSEADTFIAQTLRLLRPHVPLRTDLGESYFFCACVVWEDEEEWSLETSLLNDELKAGIFEWPPGTLARVVRGDHLALIETSNWTLGDPDPEKIQVFLMTHALGDGL